MNVWKNIRVAPVVLGQDHQLELRQFRESVQGIIEKFTSDERHSRALVDSVRTSMTQILAVEGCAALMGLMWYSSFWMWLQKRHGVSPAERLFSVFSGPETSIAKELASPLPLLLLFTGSVLLGCSGMNILQYRRNAVKRKLARESSMCHERLVVKLDSFVQEKARKTVSDTMLWLQPFLQAIKTEHERIEEVKGLVTGWHDEVAAIGAQIEDVTEQLAHPMEETETDIYPVSKPLAYPTAVPLGPTRQTARKSFVNSPPSYGGESSYYLPTGYPSLERVPSSRASSAPLRSPTNPQHFTYSVSQQVPPSSLRLSRQVTSPVSSTPPLTPRVSKVTVSESISAAPGTSSESEEVSPPPTKKVVVVAT